MEIKKILAPVDFSERCEAAVEHAASLASTFDSHIIVLHVAPPPYSFPTLYGGTEHKEAPERGETEGRRQAALERLREFGEKFLAGRDWEPVALAGDPALEIEQVAAERAVDLIVMSTRARSRLRRFILGSVAAKVLHDVKCPVLTGAHLEDKQRWSSGPHHQVGCALDLKPHSEAVLRWAWQFAGATNAKLTVFHATTSRDARLAADFPGLEEQPNRAARRHIEGLIDRIKARASIVVEDVSLSELVREVIPRHEIELLIIGRSMDDSMLGRLRTESSLLIREAPCPVISV